MVTEPPEFEHEPPPQPLSPINPTERSTARSDIHLRRRGITKSRSAASAVPPPASDHGRERLDSEAALSLWLETALEPFPQEAAVNEKVFVAVPPAASERELLAKPTHAFNVLLFVDAVKATVPAYPPREPTVKVTGAAVAPEATVIVVVAGVSETP